MFWCSFSNVRHQYTTFRYRPTLIFRYLSPDALKESITCNNDCQDRVCAQTNRLPFVIIQHMQIRLSRVNQSRRRPKWHKKNFDETWQGQIMPNSKRKHTRRKRLKCVTQLKRHCACIFRCSNTHAYFSRSKIPQGAFGVYLLFLYNYMKLI